MSNGEHIVKELSNRAFKQGRDISSCFTEMLDKFIDFLSYERLEANMCNVNAVLESIKDDEWFDIFIKWVEWVGMKQKSGKVVDAFDFYEGAVKSKGKADMLGQFYTPMQICDCMAEMIDEEPTENVVLAYDCAVGSGRTLPGHANAFIRHNRPNVAYYIGGDIDQQSVKMCTLNLAINGLLGRVLWADGLQLQYYGGYEINECKYPFWTDAISIRKMPDPAGYTNIDDIQRECNSYNGIQDSKRKYMEALYQCRIGNPQPCIDCIPESQSEIEKMIAEMQIVNLSKTLSKHYGFAEKTDAVEIKEEVEQIEAPKQTADTSKMVQRSLFD